MRVGEVEAGEKKAKTKTKGKTCEARKGLLSGVWQHQPEDLATTTAQSPSRPPGENTSSPPLSVHKSAWEGRISLQQG